MKLFTSLLALILFSASCAVAQEKSMKLSCSSFKAGETLPKDLTEDGKNLSPELSWEGVPKGVKELVLVMEDSNAPTPTPWVHWVVYGISPKIRSLPPSIPPFSILDEPIKLLQGTNSWGTLGYKGPAPPPGSGAHHYHFKLYGLNKPSQLPENLTKQELFSKIESSIIASTELVGTYERK